MITDHRQRSGEGAHSHIVFRCVRAAFIAIMSIIELSFRFSVCWGSCHLFSHLALYEIRYQWRVLITIVICAVNGQFSDPDVYAVPMVCHGAAGAFSGGPAHFSAGNTAAGYQIHDTIAIANTPALNATEVRAYAKCFQAAITLRIPSDLALPDHTHIFH